MSLNFQALFKRKFTFVRQMPEGVTEEELFLLDDLSSRPPAMFRYRMIDYFNYKTDDDFDRIEELLLFYYTNEPEDRAAFIEVVDPIETLPVFLFCDDDYKERTNSALSILYEIRYSRPAKKRKIKEVKHFTDYLSDDGKRLYDYIREKLIPVTGKIIPFAEVHVVLVKKGYLKIDSLPKWKGKPQRKAIIKLYHDAFGYDLDPKTFMSHVKNFSEKDPLSPNCQALALEFKHELRRIITSDSRNPN